MPIFADIMMFAWVPMVVVLSALMRKRHQSVLLVMLVGWMFLPLKTYEFTGIPEYDKVVATNLGVLAAVFLFDLNSVLAIKPRWFDIPICVYCFGVILTSLSNDLGLYDGFSWAFGMAVTWGVPYFVGRLYFHRYEAQRDLVIGVLIATLVYVPLALIEMRMYPQMHMWVYGSRGRVAGESYSIFGPLGYRPTVFMNSAFSVSMTFAMAAVLAGWAYFSGAIKRWQSIPMWMWAGGFALMTVLCKVLSGIGEMTLAVGALVATKFFPSRAWLVLLLCVPLVYIGVRSSGSWSGETLTSMASVVSERRAQSFNTRLENEDRLVVHAMDRPILGWGKWGRNRVYSTTYAGDVKDITRTDGLWIIVMGTQGLLGLAGFLAAFLIPVVLALWRCPKELLNHWSTGPMIGMCAIIAMHMIDNIPNAMPNPIFPLMVGGLAAWTPAMIKRDARQPEPTLVSGSKAPRRTRPTQIRVSNVRTGGRR